jgi:hypothetical protein
VELTEYQRRNRIRLSLIRTGLDPELAVQQSRKQPEWIRRMQEGKLPAKAMTEAGR